MRTNDLAEMGDGWRRMRASTTALLLASVVIALAAALAVPFTAGSRTRFALAIGEAVLLVSIAGIRVAIAIAIGPLRRRRAFEPDRVREGPQASLGWPYWLVLAGAVLAVAMLFPSWLGFLDNQPHKAATVAAVGIWAGVVGIGLVLAAFALGTDKDGSLRASAALGEALNRLLGWAAAAGSRFLWEPIAAITERVHEWIPEGDGGLAQAAAASGRLALAAARAPSVPLLVVIAAALALAVGLATPGLFR
jgi:hypothetical protein